MFQYCKAISVKPAAYHLTMGEVSLANAIVVYSIASLLFVIRNNVSVAFACSLPTLWCALRQLRALYMDLVMEFFTMHQMLSSRLVYS